jgi:carbon-monoxide dehydrogenase medium subunit
LRFEYYYEPSALGECIELLGHYGADGCILAGGTDLVVKLRSGLVRPKAVISLRSLTELSQITCDDGDGIYIGSMVTLRDIVNSDFLVDGFEVIRQGARHVSSMQIRNVATLGGNSCNASPSADTVPGLIVSQAQPCILGPKGERRLPLEDFFQSAGKTVLSLGEVLTGFYVPSFPPNTGCFYKKYSIRGDTDLAIVGIAASLTLDKGYRVQKARIALGAVAPTPIRALKAESVLLGRHHDDGLLEEAATAASEESKPISDQRATARYRREMVRVWTKHVLEKAFQRAYESHSRN